MWNKKLCENRRNKDRNNRLICIEHYSKGKNNCFCCGESFVEFLAIDHISGGGYKHRIFVQTHYRNIYWFLIRNKFPEGYRVLAIIVISLLDFMGIVHTKNSP